MLEEIKRNCIVQSSPRIAHPSTPAPHYSQIMPLYYFYNIWIFLPFPPRCKPIYMNCSNTALHPYRITDLFSTGICLCSFYLNCTFLPGSCEKYTSAGGLAMSACLVYFYFFFVGLGGIISEPCCSQNCVIIWLCYKEEIVYYYTEFLR